MTGDTGTMDTVTLVDAAAAAGVTYRQANYWVDHGYVQATMTTRDGEHQVTKDRGHGYTQRITTAEAAALKVIGDLVSAGMQPAPAARMARSLLQGQLVPIGSTCTLQLVQE